MKIRSMDWIAWVAIAVAGFSFTTAGVASTDDESAVRTASEQFYGALNAMFTGNVDPMQEVWSHANDVTYMGPNDGFEIGWDQVLEVWEAQAALKLGGKVEASVLGIAVGDNLAVMYSHEKGANTNASGEAENVSIRATNVFRKEGGQWKMIGHHTDLLPFLTK